MNRIKELRELHRMTQIRLSIELEVSQETISAYEKGKYHPSFQTLVKLSEIFGTSIDYIMGLSDQINAGVAVSKQEDMILSYLRRLDERQKERVLAYIQGISEQ